MTYAKQPGAINVTEHSRTERVTPRYQATVGILTYLLNPKTVRPYTHYPLPQKLRKKRGYPCTFADDSLGEKAFWPPPR